MERLKPGDMGWIGLTLGVVAFDTLSRETLSGAMDRYLERPYGRFAAIGMVGLTAAHLLNCLPQNYDPIHLLAEGVRDIRKEAL